jgi:hypothetical protein
MDDDRCGDTMTAATALQADGRVLTDAPVAQGVDTVFLIPGTQLNKLCTQEGLR